MHKGVQVGRAGSEKRLDFERQPVQHERRDNAWRTLQHVPLPAKLQDMYLHFDNLDEEFYSGAWTFLSAASVHSRYMHMVELATHPVVDFAIRNAGMGHVDVCAYDPCTSKVFARRDGGSNDAERRDSYHASLRRMPSEMSTFEAWLCIVQTT